MLMIVAALAVVVASQLAAAHVATAAQQPTRKVALGVSMFDGRDLAMLDDFKASIGGQRVAIWSIWRGWGFNQVWQVSQRGCRGSSNTGRDTDDLVGALLWFNPADPRFMKNQNVIDGMYDDYIREFAREAKAFGDTILLRYAHQSNSDYLPWDGGSNFGNTVDTFKTMWRHVHPDLRRGACV